MRLRSFGDPRDAMRECRVVARVKVPAVAAKSIAGRHADIFDYFEQSAQRACKACGYHQHAPTCKTAHPVTAPLAPQWRPWGTNGVAYCETPHGSAIFDGGTREQQEQAADEWLRAKSAALESLLPEPPPGDDCALCGEVGQHVCVGGEARLRARLPGRPPVVNFPANMLLSHTTSRHYHRTPLAIETVRKRMATTPAP